jgi:regulator of replication initiation timing
LSTLNWRRDPGYEQRMMQHEQRMKQLRNETEQLRSETEQLRKENARLAELNAKLDAILFSSATSSTPPPSTPDKPET